MSKIFLYQNLGFLCVITIGYLDELLKLPALIFSDHPFVVLHRRTTLEMLLFLAIWLLVSSSTRHLLKRIHELEHFLRVCSWCRRINYRGNWIQLEDFMEQGFDTPTTHGICPECLTRQKEALERSKTARKNATAAG
ncbi:MAG TPA: hypothetical protein VHG89_13555 [Verrucomicrobiae bacterium]|nr:hypothetical protein [Verrucomicrobiae bacterium]